MLQNNQGVHACAHARIYIAATRTTLGQSINQKSSQSHTRAPQESHILAPRTAG